MTLADLVRMIGQIDAIWLLWIFLGWIGLGLLCLLEKLTRH
jgi:hypothetical protein